MSGLLAELKKGRGVQVPFNISQEAFERAGKAFLSALEMDEETKEQIYYCDDETDSSTMGGFRKRRREQGDHDSKDYFHYSRRIERECREAIEANQDPRLQAFLNHARSIYEEAARQYQAIFEELEAAYPGIREAHFPQGMENHRMVIRFLCYQSNKQGEFLAKKHFDRGSLTMALFESSPGLVVGDKEEQEERVYHERQALLFPGIYFTKQIDRGVPAGWHGVEQKGEDRVSKSIARYSIVAFTMPLHPEKVTPEDSGRVRETA